MKVYFIALIATLITPLAFSSSTRTTLNDAVNLVFEEPFILPIEADKPLHIGFTSAEFDCEDICVEMEQITEGGVKTRLGAQHGASALYEPINGEVVIAFHYLKPGKKAISVHKEKRVCDSEACSLLTQHNIRYPYDYSKLEFDWKRVTIKTISSMKKASDGSYTQVTGETVFGGKFDIFLLNWLIEPNDANGSCASSIKKRENAFSETGKGYSFSGSFISHSVTGVKTPIMVDIGCGNWNYDEQKDNFL